MYGGGIRFGVSFPNQSLAPNLCPSSWMDGCSPFFLSSNLQRSSWLGVPLENSNGSGWAQQRRAGERIDRDRSEPPRRRERNETTATERRAGSMVRIRWAPGDRGEAPASSRFRTKVPVSRRETERERERETKRERSDLAETRSARPVPVATRGQLQSPPSLLTRASLPAAPFAGVEQPRSKQHGRSDGLCAEPSAADGK